ncbi:hypothetical protein [Amycolatopsis speibonae]|uniref:Uncharacterized protein n=1 Tax=Amycolatopsis speibonae TaxID=1450224 RepID=A0ABV7PCC6_9PSEU
MGTLPDVCVPDTSAADWQAVFDLVKSRGWKWEFRQGAATSPSPLAAEAFVRPVDAELGELKVPFRGSTRRSIERCCWPTR